MRVQLLAEYTLYVLLYLIIIFGSFTIITSMEKEYVSISDSKKVISYFYTQEKLLDLLSESEVVQIKLHYPLQSSLKHQYSIIAKKDDNIIILSR
ncbi:MAG TPA: hypothetical protein EYH09_00200 [Candidatus Nanopusillus sp.]|nr:hypothetical protein [Candidatus Nanopusillus sp.]